MLQSLRDHRQIGLNLRIKLNKNQKIAKELNLIEVIILFGSRDSSFSTATGNKLVSLRGPHPSSYLMCTVSPPYIMASLVEDDNNLALSAPFLFERNHM
jgi:hypothetical protein